MAKRSVASLLMLLLSSSLIATASAAIYYSISSSMTFQATLSPVHFTSGDDTPACGGTIGTNATSVTFTSIPLAVEANITITELVNVTNADSLAHTVTVSVASENFGNELTLLALYFVSPSGTQTLVIQLGDSGNIVTEDISVNIPLGQEWAIKLEGRYDSGTMSTQTNTMTLAIQVTG